MRQIGTGCTDISELEKRLVNEVLDSGRLSYGKYLKEFENRMAYLHDCSYGIAVNSGTDALRIGLACLKEVGQWKDGDEVIVPATTFVASPNIVLQNNLYPVFVDVDLRTYNIDVSKIEEKITDKTRAIMPVHLFGQPADMDEVMKLADTYDLDVIEDSCETIGARYKTKPVGSFGEISAFSSYIAHIVTTGVGGMITTNNIEYARICRSLANHGRDNIYMGMDDIKGKVNEELHEIVKRRFNFIRLGYSSRLTELEGALGVAQMERIDEILSKRKENAKYLMENLYINPHLKMPFKKGDREHSYMMFPILLDEPKDKLIMYLEDNGIETRDLLPLITQPLYKERITANEYPNSALIASHGFYIGCHQKLTKDDLDYVISKFKEYYKC